MVVATVPVDMVSEKKELNGYMSYRQLIYVIIGFVISYGTIVLLPNVVPGLMGYVLKFVAVLPIDIFLLMCAAMPMDNYDMFFDRYLLLLWQKRDKQFIWYYQSKSEKGE